MKRFVSALMAGLALAASVALTACGGGGSESPDQPLSIEDDAPEAYTAAYLEEHPNLLIQPEHLITAEIEGDEVVRVRLHVREAMTLSLAVGEKDSVLSRAAIVDSSGVEVLTHRPGSDVATATIGPGKHTIVLTPNQRAGDGRKHRVYLKLADTVAQAERRAARLQAASAGHGLEAGLAAPMAAVGVVSSDDCIGCSFKGANLANETFSAQNLTDANFDGSHLYTTQFDNVECPKCSFANLNLTAIAPETHGGGWGTQFSTSNLQGATISVASPGLVQEMWFNGVNLSYATLAFTCQMCNFDPDPYTDTPTSLAYADLTQAALMAYNNAMFMNADFSYAKVSATTFALSTVYPRPNNIVAYRNAKFDYIQPANIFTGQFFKGVQLLGVSFAGVDLSSADLSGALMVTQADYSKAILSNGTSGASFAGVDFGAGFHAFAGIQSVAGSGKDLSYVDFTGAKLYQANLTQVKLRSAKLWNANLSYANLYGADLTGAQIGAAQGSATSPGNLTGAYMPLANLSDADLRSVSLSMAHIYGHGATFARADLSSADFTSASLQEADFTSVTASDTVFDDTALVNAAFSGAHLDGAKFTGARLQGTDFSQSTDLRSVSLANAATEKTAGTWNFSEQNSPQMSYGYNATQLGALGTSAVSGATCPNGESAPCNTDAKLVPLHSGPYPSRIPGCNPVYKDPNFPNCTYCNCLAPAPPQ